MASRRTTHDVAIVAMGCTPFRDHWNSSADDLLVDAVQECVGSLPTSPSTTSTRSGSAPRVPACPGRPWPARCGWPASR